MSVLKWTWVLLPVMMSLILLSSCNTGGGSSTTIVVVWNSNEDLDGAGTDLDIFFSRSTDGGASWSAVKVLNSNAASDETAWDYFPGTMTDGNGTWVAAWYSSADIDYAGTDLDILFSRSTDDGVTWSGPHLLDSNATSGTGEDRLPSVMTDGSGTWVTVWRSMEIFNDSGIDRDIFFSRSTDNGASWSASQVLGSANTDSDERPVVMTDGNGTWVTAWFSNEDLDGAGADNDIFFSRSIDNSATWGESQLLNSNATTDETTDDDWHPVLMTDGDGTWIAAWNYFDGATDTDIRYARSTNGGASWSTPQALNSNAAQVTGTNKWTGLDIRPILLPSGAEGWTAVWLSNEDLNVAGTDLDIFFSRSVNGGVSWGASQALNSNAATDTGDDGYLD
ncbi:MAG TPA: sialidase family protein [Spirochaetota bacterium]|nr:sialidase family protein [Spirochaetota bacterium]